jgi:hypothetical protein
MIEQATAKAQFLKENLKPGEVYAGLILGKNGEPDYHLIKLPGEAQRLKWADAIKWAKEAGGELPTRREQPLLFANLKEEFQAAWYWSCEEHASTPDYAWMQTFHNGTQYHFRKSNEYRACAVRRLKIL